MSSCRALAFAVGMFTLTGTLSNVANATTFEWTSTGTGSWFDSTNWVSSPAGVTGPPGINDDSSITNGGTVEANGGTLETTRVHVGSTSIATGGPATPNDLLGTLNLNNTVMDLNQLLWVGVMKGANATSGRTATGKVATTGTAAIDTSVTGVGIAENTTGNVTVQGNLTVDGFLTGYFSGFGGIGIAANAGGSEARGHVIANNGADVSLQVIGYASETGYGEGSFTVANGHLTLPNSAQYLIGRATGSGTGIGHLEVTNGDILTPGVPANVFGNSLTVGSTFDPSATGDLPMATGSLIARNGPTTAFGNSLIGVTRNGGIAHGTVMFTDSGLSMDDPSGEVGEWDMSVGVAGATPSVNDRAGNATGILALGGILRGAADNNPNSLGSGGSVLDIGALFGGAQATADGTVNASGVEKFNLVRVGYAQDGASGTTATGRLNVGVDGMIGNGDFFSDLWIGNSFSDADAHGDVQVTGGDISNFGGAIYIGRAAGNGTAHGTLTIDGGSIATPRWIIVGLADTDDNATPTAEGAFMQTGGTLTLADFSSLVIGSANVGSGSNGSAHATGTAILTDVTANVGFLSVGTSRATGEDQQVADASGTLTMLNSTMEVANSARIGDASFGFGGTNQASGVLNMIDSELVIGPNSSFPGQASLAVGTAFGVVAEAMGQVTLTRSHISAERLNLGEGSHLIFDIEGLSRISEYGAIDIAGCVVLPSLECSVDNPGFANLDGVAEIRFGSLFDFDAALGEFFDLIVATTFSFKNFSGSQIDTFFDDVVIKGLDPRYVANAFIYDGGDFEAFRVALAERAVPEPSILLLFGIGIAGVVFSRNRRTV